MTTARAFVAAAAIAIGLLGCSKDDKAKTDPGPTADAAKAPGPADAAPAKTADAAAPAAADAGTAATADAAAGSTGQVDTPDTPDTPDDDTPKNVKLLPKSWKVPRIKKEMKAFNKALGVKCDYCHDQKDFASDANKHKPIARKMMVMTRAMNKQFFKGKQTLSCMTCHQGQKEPEK